MLSRRVALAAPILFVAMAARAQPVGFPNRPVRTVVPLAMTDASPDP
jgi:tripartite-type tricarboxylate transporter receptor subunit TctC